MLHRICVIPQQQIIQAETGGNLLQILREAGFFVDAVCGGNGSCGKCTVWIDRKEVQSCKMTVDRDLTVYLPDAGLGAPVVECFCDRDPQAGRGALRAAFDIGTTTVVGYLLDGQTGRELCCASMLNPQIRYGADVISRIQQALHGHMEGLRNTIRGCVAELIRAMCRELPADPDQIEALCIVGNPAMQQLFLGILPENLAKLPFRPVLLQPEILSAGEYLPVCPNAELLVVPNIAGFVGADTLACVLATELFRQEEMTLLVDIGTNGEMVLGNRHGMVACAAAAGPALEGACIQFGMRGQAGAIDHIRLENGALVCSVIHGGEAVGICGSGIIDAVAAALDAGWINARGKILREDARIPLTGQIYLSQEDIRQVQLAKGAIAAGIGQMAAHLGIAVQDIQKVYLAGAFGSYMDPDSACRIGLLPNALQGKITAVGNAAGSGARQMVCDRKAFSDTRQLLRDIQFIELATAPDFQRDFARCMRF